MNRSVNVTVTSTTISTTTQGKRGVVKKTATSTATLKNTSCSVAKERPTKDAKLKDKKSACTTSAKPPPPAATRVSKRIAKQVQEKEPKTRAAASRRRVETKNTSTSEHVVKRPTRVTRSNSGKVVNASAVSSGVGKRVATPVQTKLAYPDSSSESTDTASPPSPPLTLTSHSAHPHSSTCHEIPESAWIPNQHVFLRRTPCKSVDEFLGPCTFSPFKFTASRGGEGGEAVATTVQSGGRSSKRRATPGKPFVFNFRKSVDITPLSLRAEMMQSDVTADGSVSVDSLDCDCTPVTTAPGTMVTKNKPTPVVTVAADDITSNCTVEEQTEPVAMDTENVLEEMDTNQIAVSMTTLPTDCTEHKGLVATEHDRSEGVALVNVGVSVWCGGIVGVRGEGGRVGTTVMESVDTNTDAQSDSDTGVEGQYILLQYIIQRVGGHLISPPTTWGYLTIL